MKRNNTEGGGPLSPGETKHLEGIKKSKAGPADKAKGPNKANRKSLSPDNAAGPSSARDFGYDGPAPELQTPPALASTPPSGQKSQHGSPVFGAPGPHTSGFAPRITLTSTSDASSLSNGSIGANISIPRGLTPAQVLGQYSFLSNLTGQAKDDFQVAIEAIKDEENAFTTIRAVNNNRREQSGRATGRTDEVNGSPPCF